MSKISALCLRSLITFCLGLVAAVPPAVHAQTPTVLADINTGTGSSTPQCFVELGGKLFFTAIAPGGTRRQLYSYDPTQAAGSQIVQVSNFNATATTTQPNWLRVLAGKLVMVANGSANGPELWEYDPAAGTFTEMATNGTNTTAPTNLLVHEGKLYYSGHNGERNNGGGGQGQQLYVYDPALPKAPLSAASPNPKRLTNLNPNFNASVFTTGCSPTNLVGLPGKVLFSANLTFTTNNGGGIDQNDNRELVMLDTATGAITTFDLAQGSVGLIFNGLAYQDQFDGNPLTVNATVGGTLYFSANVTTGGSGSAFWRGQVLMKFNPATMAAPVVVKELNADSGVTVTGDSFATSASYAPGDTISAMCVVGTKLYYIATDGGATTGSELYVCDTTTDTVTVAKDLNPGTASGTIVSVIGEFGGKLFFAGTNGGSSGTELWRFDPATGTATQFDLDAGAGSSNPAGFFQFDGKLYFRATTAAAGTELFVYDPAGSGTAALVADLFPGSSSGGSGFNSTTTSQIPTAAIFKNQLLFQGNNGTGTGAVGSEPFVLASPVSISASPTTASEASGTVTTWTIARTGSTTNATTVNFSVGGTATFSADYTQSGAATFTASAGSVTMAAGVSSKTFTTTPVTDALSEGDETITITLSNQVVAGVTTSLGGSATMTITNSVPAVPEIAVEQPAGTDLTDGTSTVGFGSVVIGGSSAAKTFTIKNTGTGNLTGLAITKDGTNAGDFTVSALGATTVTPGNSTTFTVTFSPSGSNARSAAIYIASNDADESPFDIGLAGSGISTNANLADLALSAGTLTPSFAPATTMYAASVGNALTSVTVTPTVQDSAASVTVNGSPVASGSASNPISLAVGDNVITVVVTAQDGSTAKTYTITVRRAASSNADLASLALSEGTLSPAFSAAQTSYTASVSNTTASVAVTPTVADSGASVSVNYTPVASGSASGPIPLAGGDNVITVAVTAADGSIKTYTVTVNRDATPEIAVEHPAGSDLASGVGTIAFGDVAVGNSSGTKTFVIRNLGAASLTGVAVTKEGNQSSDFVVSTSGLSATVASGSSTTFTVTFTPGAIGTRSAVLHIASNDADENPFDITLSGNGLNGAPVAVADSITRVNNSKVAKVLKTTLLSNDTDPEGETLSLTGVSGATPAGATVALAGTFVVYTAPAVNSGDGGFQYTLSDGPGGHTVTGTVSVTQVPPAANSGPNAASTTVSGSDTTITFLGVPGASYRVQYTTNTGAPYTWNEFNPLAVYPAPANGVVVHTDTNPPPPARLYRAIPHP